ncbi:TonB-dependent receptor [Oceanihabitans sp. IOP_32]|uniref:TonB-dependent receptor n=1 Tax=Oceanihabitans sp. IOP_32 TaxID=2529032 RepID=UPI0012940A51|nr:TonB-dependent receptor [Oceanihabitans sp. IOP_32]QFZ55386.1 TonB-dependent receptor [Oceanihabitans sp. IOP_32]
MRKHKKYILLAIVTLSVTTVFSQIRKNDTINTGVVDIVKPYKPTISDAFKVKEVPPLVDEETATKKELKYNILSFPVASTFTPAKGKAAVVEKAKPIELFDNYATLAVGTYTTILGEVYLNHALSRTESVGGYLSHHSSQGGIEGLAFDDNFSSTKLNAKYSNELRDFAWQVEGGFQHDMFNWYGVPESQITVAQANSIDVDHTFYSAHLAGDITFENSYINSASLLLRHFGDDQDSEENRFIAKAKVDVPINSEEISTEVKLDYIGGTFYRAYSVNTPLEHRNIHLAVSPTYQLKQDDLTVNVGASVSYLRNFETKDNNFYVYPNVTATYRLVSDVLIAYGGITGELIQNSYYDFASENPFVSPTLFVTPTDQQYNGYLGLKGKITRNSSYNISASYVAENNKALIRNNEISLTTQNYAYGNSFGTVYDDVETFGIAGEIAIDVARNFKMSVKAEYFKYSTDNEAEAWNLPELKGSLFLDYQVTEQIFAGANLFYVGERKDQFFLNDGFIFIMPSTVVLESYFDANAHVGYHINDKFSVFAKANNITNEGYQKWQNFPVQSFQVLAGATYKFDF